MAEARELDIALFGATGFVGRLVAEYVAANAPGGLRIGLAGRSAERLTAVRNVLGPAASDWAVLMADATDPDDAQRLAQAARVVVTTVGPYRKLGLPLAGACAAAGTDYADLTGEMLFVRESIKRHNAAAVATGARIVHSCGFDSIPSDLGVLALHEAVRLDGSGDLEDTALVLNAMRGGVSGGTLASLLGQLDEMRASPAVRAAVRDPYALSPDRAAEPELGNERDLMWARHDPGLGMWVAPFLMAGFNTRVVRRSNALQKWAYGREFRYREVTGCGSGLTAPVQAAAVAAGTGTLAACLAVRPVRALLHPVLPAPGQGPSEKTRRSGYFRIKIHGRTSSGARYVSRVEAQGDPGYAATAVMLGETGLCLALDHESLPDRAGVLTPATAAGMPLIERLRAAGQTIEARRLA